MINYNNALSFVRYFKKCLVNLSSLEGDKFCEDYEQYTNSRLTSAKAHHLIMLLDNAYTNIERLKMLELWADKHISPTARKQFLTAECQKKASWKSDLATFEAKNVTHYMAKYSAKEIAPELVGLTESDVLDLLASLGLNRLKESKKSPGNDIFCEAVLEERVKPKAVTETA
ncbi:hypothetical protein [Photobacterium sanguinicancri]|uniref:hypothetical protein n=1 Tax=Photobacterium sanguinicancri TaxID=875932 RepID=UPI0021C414B1|nr:hypothetical protein [Photobacterium sanguinicancri]